MDEVWNRLRGGGTDGTGNTGGLQGPFEGSQTNLRMLQHSNSSTSINTLQEAQAYQADMIRAQVLASHPSGSNLGNFPSYLRPAGVRWVFVQGLMRSCVGWLHIYLSIEGEERFERRHMRYFCMC